MSKDKPNVLLDLQKSVKEVINQSGKEVQDRVVKQLAEKVIEERVSLLLKVLDIYENLMKDFRKLEKPDHVWYNDEGKEVKGFTSENRKQYKETVDKAEKIEKAVSMAVVEGDWSKLNNFK